MNSSITDVRLALPQQPVVDEDAGQLVADRLGEQGRDDRRIDAAGQPADHPVVADPLRMLGDRLRDEVARVARCPAAADLP